MHINFKKNIIIIIDIAYIYIVYIVNIVIT